jgi:hypothetical protein
MILTGTGINLNFLTVQINVIYSSERNLHLRGQRIVLRYSYSNRLWLVVSVTFVFAHQSHVMTFRTVFCTDLTKGNIDHIQ